MIKLTKEDKRVIELISMIKKEKDFDEGISGEDFLLSAKSLFEDHAKDIYGEEKKFLRNEYQLIAYGCALAVRIIEGKLRLSNLTQETEDELEKMRFGIAVMWGILLDEAVELDKKVSEKTK